MGRVVRVLYLYLSSGIVSFWVFVFKVFIERGGRGVGWGGRTGIVGNSCCFIGIFFIICIVIKVRLGLGLVL